MLGNDSILGGLKHNSVSRNSREEGIERISRIPRVIPLKLILNMVPSPSADFTRLLRGCFRGIDVEE
mgnify:CR=1 FL=1